MWGGVLSSPGRQRFFHISDKIWANFWPSMCKHTAAETGKSGQIRDTEPKTGQMGVTGELWFFFRDTSFKIRTVQENSWRMVTLDNQLQPPTNRSAGVVTWLLSTNQGDYCWTLLIWLLAICLHYSYNISTGTERRAGLSAIAEPLVLTFTLGMHVHL